MGSLLNAVFGDELLGANARTGIVWIGSGMFAKMQSGTGDGRGDAVVLYPMASDR